MSSSGDRTDGAGPAGIAHPEDPVRLVDYWRVLVRRRTVVVACLLAAVLTTAVVTFTSAPVYHATATMQIERRGPDILTYKDVVSVDSSWSGYQDFYQTQYKILQSRAVQRIAAERLDLVNRPEYANRRQSPVGRFRSWLASFVDRVSPDGGEAIDPLDAAAGFLAARVNVRPIRNSHLVRVGFSSGSPEFARDAANGIADAYRQFNLEARYDTTEQAKEFLTKQVGQLQAEIAEKERELQEASENKEILALWDDTQDVTSQALADLNAEHVRARARLVVAEARFESVLEAESDSLTEILQSSLITHLKQENAEIERRLSQMAGQFDSEWPPKKQLEEELIEARERLLVETETVADQVRNAARTDYEQALGEVAGLAQRVEEEKRKVNRVNRDAVEIQSLKAEIKTKRSFLSDMVSRQSETEVSNQLRETEASNIRVVDRASTPRIPIRPKKISNFMIGTLIGVVLGVGVALLLDHLDNTLKSESDIRRLVDVPVLGHLPILSPRRVVRADDGAEPASGDPVGLGSHIDPHSAFAEAFKNLRTSLLLASPDRPPRHVLITSCEPGDGKSSIAVNLATVLAQTGRQVVLVDADLRRPRVHRILNLVNERGLSSLLSGNAVLDDVLQASMIPNLDVITSGPIPPTPSELLGSSGLERLLDELSTTAGYECVVLDSPPSAQVTDSVVLATRADSTVLVVRAGQTTRESLTQAHARLRRARSHLTGIVLNGATEDTGHYYTQYRPIQGDALSDRDAPAPRRFYSRRRARGA